MSTNATIYLAVLTYDGQEYVTETKVESRTFSELVEDVWHGQIENISRLWRIESGYGTFEDETKRLAEALGDMSFHKAERPYPALRKFIENNFVDYYDADGEAYDVAMRREHGTHHRSMQF